MSSQNNPSYQYESVTPSDSVNFTGGRVCRALYIGGAGNLVAVDKNGTAVTFSGIAAGSVLPIRCIRVNATSTTATLIVALF